MAITGSSGHATSRVDGRPHVAVIGGGLAGLAAAYRLINAASPPHVTLLEASSRLGGKVRTEVEGPYQLELGPDSFLAVKPRGVGLATELGLGDALIAPTHQPRRAAVLSRGRLEELPEGLSGLVPTRLGPVVRSRLLSARGKARFATDLWVPARPGDADESLAAFIRRRLGRDAYDRLVEPLMAGIYAGDGERLSLGATFPQLRQAELTHGSLIRGMLAARATPPSGPARPAFLTPAGGLGLLIESLTTRLQAAGADIRPGTEVTGVEAPALGEAGATFRLQLGNGDVLAADGVIFAAPAFVGGKVLAPLGPALASELAGIPHGSTAIVLMAFPRTAISRPLASHGYIIPRAEERPALAATFVSEKWPGRAPADELLIRVFLGRFGQEEVATRDDVDLVALARQELAATLGIETPPRFVRVQRWLWGMPQYVLGHLDRLDRIERLVAAHPGLALAGNAYRGVGLPDVIASGERAADTVMTALTKPLAAPATARST